MPIYDKALRLLKFDWELKLESVHVTNQVMTMFGAFLSGLNSQMLNRPTRRNTIAETSHHTKGDNVFTVLQSMWSQHVDHQYTHYCTSVWHKVRLDGCVCHQNSSRIDRGIHSFTVLFCVLLHSRHLKQTEFKAD